MKLWGVFRFELAYQVRRASTWLVFAALLAFTFLFTRDGSLSEVQYADFFLNAPYMIAAATVFGCVIWLLASAGVAGEAAARDVATGMYPLTHSAPVSKIEYLGGRFLAAFVLDALLLLAVPAGNLLAVHAPGVHPDAVGPFRPAAYLTAYAFIALPNAFVAVALQFSLATRSGRPMASYLGSLFLVFMAFFVASFLLFRRGLGTLLDPIGMRFFVEDASHLWTTVEKNERLLALEGPVLGNRLLWLGLGLLALAATYLRFRFAHRGETIPWWRRTRRRDARSPVPARIGISASTPVSVPKVARTFGLALDVRQTLVVAWHSFRAIAKSWGGLALLVGIPMLTVLVVLDQMASMATPLVPTTARVLSELTAPLSSELSRWVIVPLLLVFFAGELVWREREAGLSEITDAMPGSDWAPFLGKLLGLGLVLVVFMALLMAAGMLAQVVLGHRDFEAGLYLTVLFGLQLPEYLLFALLAFVLHVLVDHKHVGHLVAIVAYAFIALASLFGVEHELLVYGAGPGWSYTEMRGFGAALGPWLWFKLYWAAWALLLAVLARLFWVRGRESGVGVRLGLARRRCTRSTARTARVAVGLVLTLGGFLFYDTYVLDEYLSTSEAEERRAEYERRYGPYESLPQPRLTATDLRVEIHPERRAVAIHGTYRLVNDGSRPIDSIHLVTATGGVETRGVAFDRQATQAVDDGRHGYRIYTLAEPLGPGDALRLDFELHVEQRGFGNHGAAASVVAKGTSFTSSAWFPFVGYQRQRELVSAAARRAHGLEPRPVIAALDDGEEGVPGARGGGIAFDAVVGTSEDEVAVAPGALRRTWTEGGRRYFHYSTDAPIGNEWTFFSADYAVHEGRWRDVAIRIFHHPEHGAHLEPTLRSVQAALDYYSEQFGAYPYRHLSLVEHPGRIGTGMHAEASMITYGQGFALWTPEEGGLDFPFAVMAHEMAHQWTVPYAIVEGAPVMSESLAWYYGMKLVEHARGSEQLRMLRSFMRQPHPIAPIRRGEPLLRGLDPYMSYRKGPFALYALSEYVGEEPVNAALRRLLETHLLEDAPLATTLDLVRELQAVTPDSMQYLLHDLFEVNTFWELETTGATAVPSATGAWHVTLDVQARKVVFDVAGIETSVPMDDWVEIGVFAPPEDGHGVGEPIYLQRHRIRSGEQAITVTVPRRPAWAGVDPRYLLIDLETRDNDREVTVPS